MHNPAWLLLQNRPHFGIRDIDILNKVIDVNSAGLDYKTQAPTVDGNSDTSKLIKIRICVQAKLKLKLASSFSDINIKRKNKGIKH